MFPFFKDILLSLAFEELSWDYTPAPALDPGCMDTFWLEFDAPEGSSDPTEVQRLQIFSKQVGQTVANQLTTCSKICCNHVNPACFQQLFSSSFIG